MEKNASDVAALIGGLPRTFKRSEPKKNMPQSEKVRVVAGLLLTRLYRDGGASVEGLEQDAAGRVTGRLALTLGAGVGGRGGMRIIRGPAGDVVLCSDNVLNLLEHLGREGLERWLAQEGIPLAEFGEWLRGLPSV
jgi:hypothetical protein